MFEERGINYEHLKDKYDALQYQYMKLTLVHNHVKTGIVEILKIIFQLKKTANILLQQDPKDEKAAFLLELSDKLNEIYEKDFREAVAGEARAEENDK
ncbi:MAG: hypothetical protein KHY77_02785 [Butyricicoccus pullicaecorum]|nr:hypothetical protein [Butyricicoccus pullicaecorum]